MSHSDVFDAVIESAKNGVTHNEALFDHPDDDFEPVLLIGRPDKALIVVGIERDFFDSERSKDLLSDIIIPGACLQFDAAVACMISSIWLVEAALDGTPLDISIAPSQNPRRIEAVMVVAMSSERSEQWMAEIVRSDLPPVLKPWKLMFSEQGNVKVVGRMADGLREGLRMAQEGREHPEEAAKVRRALEATMPFQDITESRPL